MSVPSGALLSLGKEPEGKKGNNKLILEHFIGKTILQKAFLQKN